MRAAANLASSGVGGAFRPAGATLFGGGEGEEESEEMVLGDMECGDLLRWTGAAEVGVAVEGVACCGVGRWVAVVGCSFELISVRLQRVGVGLR